METFEIVTMVVALGMMFAAVVVKVATAQLINRMQSSIASVNQARQKTLGELRLVQSQKKVAEQNKTVLIRKKKKIQKKIGRLQKELSSMREETEHRQKMRETMRGKLVRPTLAAPQAGEESEALE